MYQYQIIITELELQILKLKVLLYNNGTELELAFVHLSNQNSLPFLFKIHPGILSYKIRNILCAYSIIK